MKRDPYGMLALICFALALALLAAWAGIGHHLRHSHKSDRAWMPRRIAEEAPPGHRRSEAACSWVQRCKTT